MVYDGDGNRVSETAAGVTTKYLVDNLNPTGYSQVLDELVSGSVTKMYTYGLQRISENQLSSPAALGRRPSTGTTGTATSASRPTLPARWATPTSLTPSACPSPAPERSPIPTYTAANALTAISTCTICVPVTTTCSLVASRRWTQTKRPAAHCVRRKLGTFSIRPHCTNMFTPKTIQLTASILRVQIRLKRGLFLTSGIGFNFGRLSGDIFPSRK